MGTSSIVERKTLKAAHTAIRTHSDRSRHDIAISQMTRYGPREFDAPIRSQHMKHHILWTLFSVILFHPLITTATEEDGYHLDEDTGITLRAGFDADLVYDFP